LTLPDAKQALSVTVSAAINSDYNFSMSTTSNPAYSFFTLPTTPSGKVLSAATLTIPIDSVATGTANSEILTVKVDQGNHDNSGIATTVGEASVDIHGPAGTSFNVDVSTITSTWGANSQYSGRIRLAPNGGTLASGHTLHVSFPSVTFYYTDIPPTPVTVTPPAMTLSLDAPAPVVIPGKVVTTAVPAFALNADTFAPSVAVTSSVTAIAPVATGSLDFPGGQEMNPDYFTTASAIALGLTTPDVDVEISYPVTVQVPATYFGNLENEPATVNLTTNRLTVAPVMNLTLKLVGIYTESADRYLTITQENIYGKDMWFKLDDAPGATTAYDSAYSTVASTPYPANSQNAKLNGGVTGRVDGPFLRKAANFNGTDAYLGAFPYNSGTLDGQPSFNPSPSGNEANNYNPDLDPNWSGSMALTVEFSIRTTTMNGVVWTGFQQDVHGNWGPSACEVQLRNGYLYLVGQSDDYFVKVRQFVSDGQWHHVIVSMPSSGTATKLQYAGLGETETDTKANDYRRTYVAIDGQIVLSRQGHLFYESEAAMFTPWTFMARPAYKTWSLPHFDEYGPPQGRFDPVNPSGLVAGDLSSVIIRPKTYMQEELAKTIYYEWSNSFIVKPEPMTVSLDFTPPFSAKGNVKKMLAVYGLPWGYENYKGIPLFTYESILSGMRIRHQGTSDAFWGTDDSWWPHAVQADTGPLPIVKYDKPVSFMVDDYLVYPVSIVGDGYHNDSGLRSIDGIISPDAVTQTSKYGNYVDDETGLPRFIDLQNDLAVPVTDFDVVTVVNYPFPVHGLDASNISYDTSQSAWGGETLPIMDGYLFQHGFFGDTDSQWQVARDQLRDSLLEAAYDGVNLWIGEWHMAQHLGFVESVDIHWYGAWIAEQGGEIWAGGNLDLYNQAGQDTDSKNLVFSRPNDPTNNNWRPVGNYLAWPQVNNKRRVVSLEPGLTDLPTTEIAEEVSAWSFDRWLPNGDYEAVNLLKRPNGLQVGDEIQMPIVDQPDLEHFTSSGNPLRRTNIISARPEGVVGRVITREMTQYYGPLGQVIDNPYKENAITIIAEVGTVVRGRPLGGRVFIEFMETGWQPGGVAEDIPQVKQEWHGDNNGVAYSNWDLDSRRYQETRLQVSQLKTVFNPKSGTFDSSTNVWNLLTSGNPQYISHTRENWHHRGLNWLGQKPTIEAGESRNFVQPMTLTLTLPAPVATQQKAPTVAVSGAMRLFNLEVRQPRNYSTGDVEENATPMELALEMRGTGISVTAPPMSLSVTAVNAVVTAQTETVILYLDSNSTTSLYLLEDN
jgi:hypothetical protein